MKSRSRTRSFSTGPSRTTWTRSPTSSPRSAAANRSDQSRPKGAPRRSGANHNLLRTFAGSERRAGDGMRGVSLLFHDVYATDPSESGFRSTAADRYKLTVPDFEAQLDSLVEAWTPVSTIPVTL